ncbi:MAG TPA: T9SS type A sorting domain-containing protein [Bacteroidetes bacterium]|nr:T9SS type A sorting domain-containing protein [Bacteroidota bacterium]
MKRLSTTSLLLLFTLFFKHLNAQEFLEFTALKAEGYGVWAHQFGHNIPINVCGLDVAYARLVSADQAPAPYTGTAAMHLVAGGNGFLNFKAALANNGYTIDQVKMKFTEMGLGPDQAPNDWFVSDDTETRMYRGGNLTFTLDGHDMASAATPDLRLVIDYNALGNCGDDEIFGHSMYAAPADASAGSPAGVQAVAAAFLQDIGNRGIKFDFYGMQPAGQGATGAVFEATSGKVTLGPVFNNIFQAQSITNGMPNQCILANVSANSTGSGDWIHIQHAGDLVCSILDSENMGLIDASIYINTNNVRVTTDGVEYFDRNFEISVAQQPAGTVRVRIYFKVSEWEAFLAANDNDGNDITQISQAKVTKFSGVACSSAVNSNGGTLLDVLEWGTSNDGNTYYIDVEVNSFSAFFLHGGNSTILPVELVYFSADYDKNAVSLKWMTAYEQENDRFEIERSMDGFRFEKIGARKGAGTREGWQHYQFVDQKTQPGLTYYYRLRQIDFDGTYEYSGVATVKTPGGIKYDFYPNPVQDMLRVNIPEEVSLPVKVELLNNLGRRVFYQAIEDYGQHEFSASYLPPGIYEVIFTDENRRIPSGMLVKQD